jgi:pyruvate/2-oxoglutarate dehydrogenase complex dihydrolipoamide acyltransferase (E2) component
MHLPAIHDPQDEVPPVPASPFAAKAAADRAAKLTARLKTQPGDPATREELARLLGGSLNQPQAAIAHVQALLDQPDAPPEKAADWLGLIAMWQLEQLQDLEAGRETLRRVIREHPRSPTAQAAQRRLQLLEMDEKLRAAQAVKPPPIRIRVDLSEKTGGG